MKYRKKPVVIEAWQWLGGAFPADAPEWLREYRRHSGVRDWIAPTAGGALLIPTLEGNMKANVGDWIIQGVKGEVYPCKPDIFAATYDAEPR